jgi:hypothetical protein
MQIRYMSEQGLCWKKKMQYCLESVNGYICQEVTVKFYSWDYCFEADK